MSFRLLHVTSKPYCSTHGGLEVYLRQLSHTQAKAGIEVSVLSILWSGDDLEIVQCVPDPEIKNVEIWEIHIPEKLKRKSEKDYWYDLFEKIKEFLIHGNFDVVHTHHGFAEISAAVCKELKIPCVYTVHCSEICCITGTLIKTDASFCDGIYDEKKCLRCCGQFLPLSGFWNIFLRIIPNSLRCYLEDSLASYPYIPFITPLLQQSRLLGEMRRHLDILRQTDALIAPSRAVKSLVERQGGFHNVSVIPHGVVPEKGVVYPKINNNDVINFYYVGRLCREKGIHVMLEAFRGIPKTRYQLHIIGAPGSKYETRYADHLKNKYHDYPVHWYGKVPHGELKNMVERFHVMIHPAICFETFGLTISEALNMKKPVLASRCGGPEMQIQDGVNGWLVQKNDAKSIRDILAEIIRKPDLLNIFSEKCSVYTFQEHYDKVSNLYLKVIHSCQK